ncbi:pre-mRNA-splicing factor cwc22 [Borealophlyctis nickersoniae]|nr:pre-mRNA-splicing factor cwc22 [Borealophlyctis nickersoniae]
MEFIPTPTYTTPANSDSESNSPDSSRNVSEGPSSPGVRGTSEEAESRSRSSVGADRKDAKEEDDDDESAGPSSPVEYGRKRARKASTDGSGSDSDGSVRERKGKRVHRSTPSPSRSPSVTPGPMPAGNDGDDENDGRESEGGAVVASGPSPMDVDKPAAPAAAPTLGRTGGAYIPPARLRAMQAAITDKSSPEYQRMAWEALKKSINGLINKVNTSNIKHIVRELIGENLIRGRGILCRSIMKAQAASLPFTHVYAALIAVINVKFPQVGELLLTRLVSQFRRAYKRSDKAVCLAVAKFVAHLFNQKVAHEFLALQFLMLLLERPTDDSVEVAVGFMRDCGAYLSEVASKATNAVFDRFRAILHEGTIDKRTQYMVEVLFQVRKDKFKDNPAVVEELDLVPEEDQMTHRVALDDELNTEEGLNVFKFDPEFLQHEEIYQQMKKEILGEDSDDDEEDEEGSDEDSDEEESEGEGGNAVEAAYQKLQIQDQTNTNLINLRRGIYLTIMSSLNFEECAHKLMKMKIEPGQEIELANMVLECCSQERTYVNFYGLLGERFCRLNRSWSDAFCQSFEECYKTIHRYETNRLRNIGKFFAHLLASDALTWEVFSLVRLTEQDTTSSSRIFIKIIFQDLSEALGLKRLNERLKDPTMIVSVQTPSGMVNRGVFDGMFPRDNPRNTRFAINYFTSIGLGGLTEELREYLKNAPKLIMAQQQAIEESSDSSDSDSSDSDDSSSDSDSSSSDSDSDSDSSDDSSSSEDDSDDDDRKRGGRGRRDVERNGRGNGKEVGRERADGKRTYDDRRGSGRGGRDSRSPSDERTKSRREEPRGGRYERRDSIDDRERSRRDERTRRDDGRGLRDDRRRDSPERRRAGSRDRRDERDDRRRDSPERRRADSRERRDGRDDRRRDSRERRRQDSRDRKDGRDDRRRDSRERRREDSRDRKDDRGYDRRREGSRDRRDDKRRDDSRDRRDGRDYERRRRDDDREYRR